MEQLRIDSVFLFGAYQVSFFIPEKRTTDRVPLGLSSARSDQEVLKETFWKGPKRHEGDDTEKGRVESIPCQSGGFSEIPVQQDNQMGEKMDTFLSTPCRIRTEEQPSESIRLEMSIIDSRSLAECHAAQKAENRCKYLVCGKSLSSHGTFHEAVHTGQETCKYLECGKTCNVSPNPTKAEKRHKCPECGKSFGQSTHLTLHRRIHTGEKPYECVLCGKTFSRKGSLTSHHRMHTGEKPYPCVECGRSFSFSSNLIRHRRTHLRKKPQQYLHSGKNAHQSTHLPSHQRIHMGESPAKVQSVERIASRQQASLARKEVAWREDAEMHEEPEVLPSDQICYVIKNELIESPIAQS